MEEKIRLAVFGQKRLSREGGIEIVVKELCTRMAQNGCDVTCYNRAGHHVSGAEYDKTIEYDGIRQKVVPTIEKKGLAAISSSFFAALYSAFGRYDVVHQNPENLLDFVQILSEELVRAKVLPEDYDFEAHKELVPMQPGDVPVTYADTSALERDFGYKPSTSLREGLRKFAEWYAKFYK